MDNKNIIFFSSGISEQRGMLKCLKEEMERLGYQCSYWRDLFQYAYDPSNIALLPSLIKKIPTFDYAVLICEGHDRTIMLREGQTMEMNVMRDNVLFEIGLCSMALGLERTILLTDEYVHIPEDLLGKNGELAVKRFVYAGKLDGGASDISRYEMQMIAEEIHQYIQENGESLTPVVIGAASSSAEGYMNNFVLRTLEHLEDGVWINGEKLKFSLSEVMIHIVLPYSISEDMVQRVTQISKEYFTGEILTARSRSAFFKCKLEGHMLHIYDFPTSIATSYNIAQMILDLDADDAFDEHAAERFVSKELKLFQATLASLMTDAYARKIIYRYNRELSDRKKEELCRKVAEVLQNRVFIEKWDY